MSIEYRIYANDGQGGPIDYSMPIAVTDSTSFTLPPLGQPSDNRFGVRAYDSQTGKEEANTNVMTRIVIDPHGRDISRRPKPVEALRARTPRFGKLLIEWVYILQDLDVEPSEFFVELRRTTPNSTLHHSESLPFQPLRRHYCLRIDSPSETGTYEAVVTVRGEATDPSSEPSAFAVTVESSPPRLVESASIRELV